MIQNKKNARNLDPLSCDSGHKHLIVIPFFSRRGVDMGTCDICGKNGPELSLLGAEHKEMGHIHICSDCWANLYNKNRFVASSGSSGSSCPTCR